MDSLNIYPWITEWLRQEGTAGDQLVWFPLLKQGHLAQLAQGQVQWGLEYCQGWTQLLCATCSVLYHPYSKNIFFLHVPMELFVFKFVPISSCPFTEKSLAPSCLRCPIRYFLKMSQWLFAGPVCPCISCTGEPRSRQSTSATLWLIVNLRFFRSNFFLTLESRNY